MILLLKILAAFTIAGAAIIIYEMVSASSFVKKEMREIEMREIEKMKRIHDGEKIINKILENETEL